VSLQGVLTDFGVADIFQLIAQQRKTGVLEISNDDRKLDVFFLEGQVVRARPSESRPDGALASFLLRTGALSEGDLAEVWRHQEENLEPLSELVVNENFTTKPDLEQVARLLAEETIFELFLWDDGSFAFRPGPVSEEIGDLMVGAEMVLLDALRMRDEWAQIQIGFGDLGVVVAQKVDVEAFREHRANIESSTGMSGDELDRLYTRCDGRSSARRVIDLSRLGTFEGARGLMAMLREGVIEVIHKAAPRPRTKRRIAPAEAWSRGAWLLLVAGLVAGGLFVVPQPSSQSFPLPQSSLAEARSAAATERLRTALEAYRWSSGNYPESLVILSQKAGDSLAAIGLDGYSYVRSGRGYTLLEK
jgi:hypothetical protein